MLYIEVEEALWEQIGAQDEWMQVAGVTQLFNYIPMSPMI